jgi:signal transduction histidine kinase
LPELWPSWGRAPKITLARRKAPWVVLVIGFGGLLACILGAAVRTVGTLDHVRGEENRSLRAYLERQSALDQIRSQIYLSGTYVRDLLLAPDPNGVDAQSSRLAGLERESRAALVTYSRSLDPEEKEPFRTLESEIDDYWRVLSLTAQWTPDERNKRRDSFFYDELSPRRTAMLQIADRIALVNERGLTRAEDRLAASSDGLRRTLTFTFGITLAIGLALAGVTTLYTLRLERRLERGLDENTRARGALQELSAKLERAQENERRTLARELHDEVGQSLSAILMEAENAECATGDGEMREHLAAVKKLAGKTVNEVRDLALLLRPSMLDDFGLAPALNWHAREMSKRTGLNVVVSADDDIDDLPDEHKTCIYRAVQEAVNNSARHANARTVEVAVKREGERVRFQVRDDGVGFDTRFVRGLGLLGMEERVRRLGGDLRLESQLGRGTLISAELPLVELKPAVKPAGVHQAETNGRNGDAPHPHPVG